MQILQTNSSKIVWVSLLIGALVVLTGGWHLLYGHSVDLGLHYALTNELFAQLGPEGVTQQYLGVMAQYPSGAHWIAVALSLVTHSPLVSIVAITELCTYAAYVTVALFLIEGPFALTLIRLMGMLVATGLLATQQAAFGYQVIVNYFFPQVVGESLVLMALYFFSREPFWTWRWPYQFAALFVVIWLLTYIQPIAAVQLGGSLVLFVCISEIVDAKEQQARWLRRAGRPLVLSAAVIIAVILHPAFRTMTTIAAHNGYLRFGSWVSTANYAGLVVFGLIASALAVYGALTNRLHWRRSLILASATTASAALLILQSLFRYAGLGSDYAVSKHVFFLATLAAATFVYAIAGVLISARKTSLPLLATTLRDAILPPLFALCALYIVISKAEIWKQDLRPILDYEAYAQHFRKFSLPLDGAGNIVSLNKSFTPTINFLVSLGDLKLPLPIAQASVNSYRILLDTPVKYAMVSSKLADSVGLARCAVGAAPSWQYAAVDRECFVKLRLVIAPNQPFATAANQTGAAYLTEGWAAAETWGIWSLAETARIEFTVAGQPGDGQYALHVKYIPFIAGDRREQRFVVVADGIVAGRYVATDAAAKEFVVPIGGGGHHVVELTIDNPQSPKDLNLSETDARKLGIGVTEISLRTRL